MLFGGAGGIGGDEGATGADKKVTRRDQNLKLKRENSNGSGYLREKHGTPQLASESSPSGLLLQGGRVSIQSSSELSSSKGVRLVRK